uniref:Calmodulin-binding domain-containing protein n=1 Tax=Vitis vinifera TaxID=29760 RepID=F6H4I7_VITVI
MVQRKVGNKLGIQADHVSKTEKRLGNLKPGFSQHQDGRNRAADMKKKMKKSRSIKLSDIESLRSSPLQPGKPPPLSAQPAAAKQSVIRPPDGSPNYMKSTSCSDARKESSQVSPRSPQTGSGSGRRLSSNSKVCSASTHRTARTSSLKLVKTLTKSPSFKPVRASTKKCSKVALCADMDAHGATCSSTLKDSNFPEYLMLNPGGTEYEGTSVIKVCPYTYCSLNGHHHAPLPPLKCFLSARRRVLKTQKTMKLEALSPRRAKLPGDGMKSIDTAQVIIDGKPAIQEVDSGSSAVSPLIQEVGMDFFIEIYAKNRDDSAEAIGSNIPDQDDEEIVDVAGETGHLNDIMPSVEGGDETTKDDGQVADSESDEPPVSEIDSGDNLDQNSDIVFAETSSERDQRAEEADEDYPPSLVPGEITPGYSSDGWESKSEATDMDWEEGRFSAQHPHNSTQGNDESNLGSGYLPEIKHPDLHDEPISKPDDIISKCFEEIFSEVKQEVIEDETNFFNFQGSSNS